MKIEIRNLKISRSLSEETTAYTADIYVDGVKSFAASNHGHGASDFFGRYPTATVSESDVSAYLKAHEAPDGPWEADPAARAPYDTGHDCDLEAFVGRFISAHEANHERKRITTSYNKLLATRLVGLRGDAFLTFGKAIHTPTPERIAQVAKANPDVVMLNTADMETRDRGLRAYCPDLPALAETENLAEAVYARLREDRETAADARWLLAENDRADKPCPDLRAHLLDVIATQEAAYAAYCGERDAARKAVA